MRSIIVYDLEAEQLDKIADENDTTIPEVVEMLMGYIEDMKRDYHLK